MKEYLEQKRAELRENEGGFTLMEMLIVVAIIAILIAIAIPVFTNQLEKAREAADLANIRAAYAEAMSQYIEEGRGSSETQPMTQNDGNWTTIDWPSYLGSEYKPSGNGVTATVTVSADSDGNLQVTVQ